PDEERAVSHHLHTCTEPHVEARSLIDAAALLPASLDPVMPSAGLRGRLMSTIAETPQDHRQAAPARLRPAATAAPPPRRAWWQLGPLPAALAAAGLAAAIGLGAWNVDLRTQLADRDAALRAVASADAAYAASGSAGSGWVFESGGSAFFVADRLAALPADRIYELWLIEPDADPVAVGVLTDTDGTAIVTLERGLGAASAFAVTVEEERVDAPTSDPVLVAALEG
ncbi:MAG: anti-sigma factor, partial [Chloroflexi bacterium]|nr:anti-sigma factor [Chloroflexota bacterium]